MTSQKRIVTHFLCLSVPYISLTRSSLKFKMRLKVFKLINKFSNRNITFIKIQRHQRETVVKKFGSIKKSVEPSVPGCLRF